ncbi:hypothetical protein GUITHDRAFT_106457 [Guillardia theta CCMP2712]|uniref:PDZ domain-containing protein n=1 Tax=Guillardia theta (strain CCMP2712) TaxID=905079 RepID=L1JHE5_GUITC|nr:hypothetical protein GUITHDRAFT_106457 [Guillardia theta CCMP2712]EKX47911.1 hypothetical protein GUITHDRAFT_106457 [Guillardia theta CCMP2712]|eukprot:XP_005834891.1 hypothetical protein GUITHDRAFT_106457 [Guillardia theta CCMP2712]
MAQTLLEQVGAELLDGDECLLVSDVRAYGWFWAYGIEVDDKVIEINGERPTSVDSLCAMLQDKTASSLDMTVFDKDGKLSQFHFSIPLNSPELHCLGMFIEIDPSSKQHIVTGIIPESPAARGKILLGSCIRSIDDEGLYGKSLANIRKLIFGSQEALCKVCHQGPGSPRVVESYIERKHQKRDGYNSGDDCEYADGWSDKQHAVSSALNKVAAWQEEQLSARQLGGKKSDRDIEVHQEQFDLSLPSSDSSRQMLLDACTASNRGNKELFDDKIADIQPMLDSMTVKASQERRKADFLRDKHEQLSQTLNWIEEEVDRLSQPKECVL